MQLRWYLSWLGPVALRKALKVIPCLSPFHSLSNVFDSWFDHTFDLLLRMFSHHPRGTRRQVYLWLHVLSTVKTFESRLWISFSHCQNRKPSSVKSSLPVCSAHMALAASLQPNVYLIDYVWLSKSLSLSLDFILRSTREVLGLFDTNSLYIPEITMLPFLSSWQNYISAFELAKDTTQSTF